MADINRVRFRLRPGFLLLDMIIGIVLISIAMLILGQYTFTIIEKNHEAQLTLRALNVATQLLDQCITTGQLPRERLRRLDSFSLEWQTERHELPVLSEIPIRAQEKRSLFQTVTLTISFNTLRGALRSQTLYGGFFSVQGSA